jgi:hypothetical protein
LKTIFDIESEKKNGVDYTLLLQIGKDQCSYALYDSSNQSIDKIVYCSYDEFEAEEELKGLFRELKASEFNKVIVSSSYPQALLVPAKYFNEDNRYLDTIYDQPLMQSLYDRINEWQIVTLYSFPKTIYEALRREFNTLEFYHTYTNTIKTKYEVKSEQQVEVNFTSASFTALVKKQGQILLAQTYSYKTPLDVVYYLLKICYAFEMPQTAVDLVVSGFIEKDSALYKELVNYFVNIHFADVAEVTIPDNSHPHYYFTSLYNLAACVS